MDKNIHPLIGKTILSIDTTSINAWKVKFTDGSSTEIWAECDGPLGLPQIWLDNTQVLEDENTRLKAALRQIHGHARTARDAQQIAYNALSEGR